jgi:hypothetical protein
MSVAAAKLDEKPSARMTITRRSRPATVGFGSPPGRGFLATLKGCCAESADSVAACVRCYRAV